MKIIKNFVDKISDIIDDIAANLGLQPKRVPARVKNDRGSKKK